jgi:transcriptional repressor NF-X1
VVTVENTFRDFIQSTRQTLILPHSEYRQSLHNVMPEADQLPVPPAKRTFVMGMADVYHLGRELIDAEPNRSVQIRRRVDTRSPHPLLSAASAPPSTRLGGLTNMRAPATSAWGSGAGRSATAAAAVAGLPVSGPTSRVASPHPHPVSAPATTAPTPVPAPAPAPAPVLHHPAPRPAYAPVADGDDDWDQDVE